MSAQMIEVGREMEVGGREVRVLESCHSTWLFDESGRSFRRIPRGLPITPDGEWTPFHLLDIDPSGSFSVSLNAEGTRWLRSRIHVEPCPQCDDGQRTTELPPVHRFNR
ncbi:MAG: hypothetical protein ACRDY7_01620 [Acidimicrobiia bacterium]